MAYNRVKDDHHKVDVILVCYIWVFFCNFESEKFSGETKSFQAKIKIGLAEWMNGQIFKSTFRTLHLLTGWIPKNRLCRLDSL